VTTIAFKDGILAADSQVTMGNTKLISSDKITVLNKDTIIACSGDVNTIILVERFFSQPDWEDKIYAPPELPKNKDGEIEVDGILISKGRAFVFYESVIPEPLGHPFYAVGTGWKFAMAAMHLGMSAPDAIAFAAQFDVYTNDKVRWIDVKEFFKKKKSRGTKGTPRVETKEEEIGGGTVQTGGGR
jgi:hypothetical protein